MTKIIDFSRGINDKVESEFINEGFVAEANNTEYNHSPILSKRYGIETFDTELDSTISNLGITASDFWVWYPSTMPTDAEGDYIVVVFGSNKLYVLKKQSRAWVSEQIIIADVTYTSSSSPVAFIGNKFLISDGTNKGHYIEVDKDGNLIYGILGIPAPIRKLIISGAGTDNEYVETVDNEADIGMGIERGNILRIVYTAEDKYGNESNPSPVSTYTDLQYRYPTVTDYAPFKYWWLKAKYSNLAIPEGLDSITKDSLEKFNIYRADVRYTEGSAESVVFYKVATIDIKDTYVDTAPYGKKEPSYEQDIAPVSKFISENSQVKFVANLKLKTVFPFGFRYYTEIKLTNENNRSYINAPIAIQLNSEDMFKEGSFSGWGDFENNENWKDHIRIFDRDKTTPLPVVYFSADNLYYILIPYIAENSVRSIYISYDESGWGTDGVSDTWKTPDYGQFVDGADSVEWLTQKVFYPNRVRSSDTLICCSNEFHGDDSVPNRADRDVDGALASSNWAEHTLEYLYVENSIVALNFNSTDDKNAVKLFRGDDGITFTDVVTDPNKGTISFFADTDNFYSTNDWGEVREFAKIYADADNYISIRHNAPIGGGSPNFRIVSKNSNGTSTQDIPVYNKGKIFFQLSWDSASAYVRIFEKDTLNITSLNYSGFRTPSGECDIIFDNDPITAQHIANAYLYLSQMYYEKNLFIDNNNNFIQYMNFSPYFPEEFLGYIDGTNNKISIEEPTDNVVKDYKNFVKWSTVNGVNFPDLWERAFTEPIKGIIPLRRKTELTVDNRMLIFGRNTLNVFTLTGEPDNWYDSTNNIIEDYKQFGILAENSLGSLNDRIFWISELGAMMFDDVPTPISMNKIDIPIDEDMIGFAIPLRNQYAFHSQSTSKTYIYNLSSDSWTTFTGLNLSLSRILSGGSAIDNKNLFLDSSGLIKSYPSSSQVGFSTTVKTRKFTLDNNILRRFRVDFDGQIRVATEIQNRSTTLNQSFEPVDRMVFRGLSNGSFGEYVQFTLTNFTKLKKLEYEIQRR